MRNKHVMIAMAVLLCMNAAAPAAALEQPAQEAEYTVEAQQDEASEEADAPASVPEQPAEEDTALQEEEVDESTQKYAAPAATPVKPTEDSQLHPYVDADGLIEDFGVESSKEDGITYEEALEQDLEDIHRGLFPGFEVDPSKYPTANITENTLLLYCFLRTELKLNHAAACGILANVHLESNFRPIALGDGGTSYGICQWHNGRFTNLMNYCREEELDYNTLEGQLEFLKYELKHKYKKVYKAIRKVDDDEDGAYEAAYLFCMRFEMPDQLIARSERRGNLAKEEYFDTDFEEMAEEFEDNEEILLAFEKLREITLLPEFVIEQETM